MNTQTTILPCFYTSQNVTQHTTPDLGIVKRYITDVVSVSEYTKGKTLTYLKDSPTGQLIINRGLLNASKLTDVDEVGYNIYLGATGKISALRVRITVEQK